MVTYLWSKQDSGKTEYIGLNGQVYDEVPEGNDLLALQSLAQSYIGDENGYKLAFNSNVAPLLGESASGIHTYYNTNNTCIPGIDSIYCVEIEDGGTPRVETTLTVDESTGNKILTFWFYNIKGDPGTYDPDDFLVYYAYSDQTDTPSGGVQVHRHYEDGDKWMGIYIGTGDWPDTADYYQWTNIQPNQAPSQFVSYVFQRRVSTPATPTGGSYDHPIPSGNAWKDSVPTGSTAPIWVSMATFKSDVPDSPYKPWSTPAKMADTSRFQVEWADSTPETDAVYAGTKVLSRLDNYTADDGSVQVGVWESEMESGGKGRWRNYTTTGTTYMATCQFENGRWSAWDIAKIKGEKGKDGVNGGRFFMIYTSVSSAYTPYKPATNAAIWDTASDKLNPETFTGQTNNPNLTAQWTTVASIVNDGDYLWMSQAPFDPNTKQIKTGCDWSSPVRLTGKDGANGVDGLGMEYIYSRFRTLEEYNNYIGGNEVSEMMNQTSHPYMEGYEVTSSTESDFIPWDANWAQTWTDSPLGVSEEWQVEACATRKQEKVAPNRDNSAQVLQWGKFGIPIVWAARGSDGIDGDGIEYIYRLTRTAQASPTTKYGYEAYTETPSIEIQNLCLENVISEIPNDETVSADPEDYPEYVYCDSCEDYEYWHKVSYQVINDDFPYDVAPDLPPISLLDDTARDSLYGPYVVLVDETYTTVLTEEQKAILSSYYQKPEFVPGIEKIRQDVEENEDSGIYGERWVLEGFEEFPETQRGWCGGWTDNPQSVSQEYPYLWCTLRRYKDFDGTGVKTWGPFERPILWSNWSDAGGDGESIFTAFAFATLPEGEDISDCALSGGSFASPVPTATTRSGATVSVNWSSAITNSEGVVWITSAIFSNDPHSAAARGWDAPRAMTDTPNFEVMYCGRYDNISTATNHIPSGFNNSPEWWASANTAGWYDNASQCTDTHGNPIGAKWMATITGLNGLYDFPWSVIEVKGDDGDFTSLAFANLEDGIDISNCTVTGGDYDSPLPTATSPYTAVTWTDAPTGNDITWMVSRKFSRSVPSSWSSPKRLVDTSEFETIYSDRETPDPVPSGFTPDIARNPSDPWWTGAHQHGWYDDASGQHGCPTDALWMATNTAKNGVFDDNAWQILRVKGEQGDPGASGESAYNSAIVYLYKRSATAPSIDWATAITYTFADGTIDSVPTGWSATIPAHDNNPLYVTAASPRSKQATYSIAYDDWAEPVMLADDGANGSNGLNSATVRLYQRTSGATPSAPASTLTYTFASGELTPAANLGNWSIDIPSGDNPCYTTQATAISTGTTDTIQSGGWSVVRKFVENGEDGASMDFVVAYSPDVNGSYNPIPAGFDNSAAWWATANTQLWFTESSACSGGAYYMATIVGTNGVYNDNDWQIVRVKGEPGSITTLEYLQDAFEESDGEFDDQPGVILREVIGVKDEDDNVKAIINASDHFTGEGHGKVMMASGIEGVVSRKKSYAFAVIARDSLESVEYPDAYDCSALGGSYENPLPTQTECDDPEADVSVVTWTDCPRIDYSAENVEVWITSKVFYSDGTSSPAGEYWDQIELTYQGGWTTCILFSPNENYQEPPTGFTVDIADDLEDPWWSDANDAGWFLNPTEFSGSDAVWMAVANPIGHDDFGPWEVIRIKNEPPERVGLDASTIIYEDGHLVTTSAEISGTIKGANIYGGTITGATVNGGTITGATINGGSLNIGPAGGTFNFMVDRNGRLTSRDATLNGSLNLSVGNKICVYDTSNFQRIEIGSVDISPSVPSSETITFTGRTDTTSGRIWSHDYRTISGDMEPVTFEFIKNSGDIYANQYLSASTWEYGVNLDTTAGITAGYVTATLFLQYVDNSGVTQYVNQTYSGGTYVYIPIGRYLTQHYSGRFYGQIDLFYDIEMYNDADYQVYYEATAGTIDEPTNFQFSVNRTDNPDKSVLKIGNNGLSLRYPNGSNLIFTGDNSSNQQFLVQIVESNKTYGIKIDSSGVKINRGTGWTNL